MSETVDLTRAVDLSQILHKTEEQKAKQLPKPWLSHSVCRARGGRGV